MTVLSADLPFKAIQEAVISPVPRQPENSPAVDSPARKMADQLALYLGAKTPPEAHMDTVMAAVAEKRDVPAPDSFVSGKAAVLGQLLSNVRRLDESLEGRLPDIVRRFHEQKRAELLDQIVRVMRPQAETASLQERNQSGWKHRLTDINPDTGRKYTPDELDKLRSVTAEKYAQSVGTAVQTKDGVKVVGLINAGHRDDMSYEEHRKVQEAYFDPATKLGMKYEHAVRDGIVRPDAITAEMNTVLKLSDAVIPQVESMEQVGTAVKDELGRLLEEKLLTKEEAAHVQWGVLLHAQEYSLAYPQTTPQNIASLALDNVHGLSYQIVRDKMVFSGSDHGDLHILMGDLKHGLEIITSLKENGVELSHKEVAAWMQAVFEHDKGYTTAVVQAKNSWEASKDHPIFSTALLDANKAYFVERYGDDGYRTIREIVLNHS